MPMHRLALALVAAIVSNVTLVVYLLVLPFVSSVWHSRRIEGVVSVLFVMTNFVLTRAALLRFHRGRHESMRLPAMAIGATVGLLAGGSIGLWAGVRAPTGILTSSILADMYLLFVAGIGSLAGSFLGAAVATWSGPRGFRFSRAP